VIHTFSNSQTEPSIQYLLDAMLVPEPPPEIDYKRMYTYRVERIREQLYATGAALCVLVNPISLRYACDYRDRITDEISLTRSTHQIAVSKSSGR